MKVKDIFLEKHKLIDKDYLENELSNVLLESFVICTEYKRGFWTILNEYNNNEKENWYLNEDTVLKFLMECIEECYKSPKVLDYEIIVVTKFEGTKYISVVYMERKDCNEFK